MMQPPLVIWWHRKPWHEFYCQGFVSESLADLAGQLKRYGYSNSQPIEVIDASTDRVVHIELEDGIGVADTIGKAISGTPTGPGLFPSPPRGSAGGWLSN